MVRTKLEPKITVGVCSGGTIRTEMATSLIGSLINMAQQGKMLNILFQIGGYVDVNRNKIVTESQKNGSTHLMFIDNDMIFPDDAILQLLKSDKDVIGANYNSRLDPTSKVLSGPTVKMLVDGVPVSTLSQDFPTKPFKCYALGTGFLLIKMSVFDKIDFPYFEAFQERNGQHHTEDIEFCRKAGEAGAQVWCDPTIKVGHIGSYTY